MKLFKSLAVLALCQAIPTSPDSSGLCEADSEGDCSGLFCRWNGSVCSVSTEFNDKKIAVKAATDKVMEGIKLEELEIDFDNNKGVLQSAADSATRSGTFPTMTFNSFRPHSTGGFMPTNGFSDYFQCPIDVPFCERQACVNPSLDNLGTNQNAFACYSQPGCCFDQNLYQYRVAFGDKFYESVPVCYRSIDNPLFNQLAQNAISMNGQFNPSFVQPIVDQVKALMGNEYMSTQMRQFQGCSARYGTPEQYYFIQNNLQYNLYRVAGDNYFAIGLITDKQKYNDFVSTLSQSCGWNGINYDECVLRGCCWNDASNSCENPIGEVTIERVEHAVQHMIFNEAFGSDNTQKSGPQIPSFPWGPLPGGATPPVFGSGPSLGGARPSFGGRKRRSMMNNLLNIIGRDNMGAVPNMGMDMFTGLTLGPKEVCPATNIARNCMASSTINQFDMMQKIQLERQCKAKDCCWDNDRYQKSLMMSDGGNNGAIESFVCPWAVRDFSMYNMPSLAYSMRGCCDYSPCVERTGRDGTHVEQSAADYSVPTKSNSIEIRHTNYQNNEDLEWPISTNCQNVRVQSTAFDTELHFDYVTIDGQQYSGTSGIDVTVPSGHFTIQFHSDKSLTKTGFVLTAVCA